MKKFIALVTVLVLTFLLTACGSSADKTLSDIPSDISTTDAPQNNDSTTTTPQSCSHDFSSPTCTQGSICTKCGLSSSDALGHSWTEATCTSPKTCSVCGQTDGSAKGHNWQEATCINPKTCISCKVTEGETAEHKYNNEVCVYCDELSPKATECNSGNDAYWALKTAHELNVEIMNSIYGAWYFAIYEAEDYLNTQSCFEAFCSEANLNYDETLNALNTVLASMGISDPTGTEQLAALRTFSIAVDVAVQVYIDNGTYDLINTNLSNAKSSLKTMTNSYTDFTGYTTLKSYYSEVSAYADFCQYPNGSFSQLKTTINTYENNLRHFQNELSFIYE